MVVDAVNTELGVGPLALRKIILVQSFKSSLGFFFYFHFFLFQWIFLHLVLLFWQISFQSKTFKWTNGIVTANHCNQERLLYQLCHAPGTYSMLKHSFFESELLATI